MPRTGLRQRANRGRPRVLTRPRAALSVRCESKPGADHGLQPQDARVPRWIWIVGLRSGTIRYAAPPVRGFERQSVHGGSDAAEAREQTGPEVHLHGFCTNADGDQEVEIVARVAALRTRSFTFLQCGVDCLYPLRDICRFPEPGCWFSAAIGAG